MKRFCCRLTEFCGLSEACFCGENFRELSGANDACSLPDAIFYRMLFKTNVFCIYKLSLIANCQIFVIRAK